ncbi:unnamed protein product [Polarella glacialis]|uniref:Uncharacterized protein n=1 Tax=Polarella glacialis TaxID=89957 RepID=A0A813J1E5_POLGL|nr:unnamed protein product [Polarella glacialis]
MPSTPIRCPGRPDRGGSPSAGLLGDPTGYPREGKTMGRSPSGAALPPLPHRSSSSTKLPPRPGGVPSPGAPMRAMAKGSIHDAYKQVALLKRAPRRANSMSSLQRLPPGHGRLPSLRLRHGGDSWNGREPPAGTEGMASTDPCPLAPSPAALLDLVRGAEEVLRVGAWSVRKMPDNTEIGLVYLNEECGRVEVEPPQEVLDALELDDEGGDSASFAEDEATTAGGAASSSTGSQANSGHSGPIGVLSAYSDCQNKERPQEQPQEAVEEPAEDAEQPPSPRFLRIILGAKTEVPLKMARDILEAIQEDPSIFEQVKQRFCDVPGEPALALGVISGLGKELEEEATLLALGEVSDVLATEAGMQILLRVR